MNVDPAAPLFTVSVAAQLAGLHPQTLRQYDRLGLVVPGRSDAGARRYSLVDIEQLREVVTLAAAGVSLEGIRRVLQLQREVLRLRAELAAARANADRTALVLYRGPRLR